MRVQIRDHEATKSIEIKISLPRQAGSHGIDDLKAFEVGRILDQAMADEWRRVAASSVDPIKERTRRVRELARSDNTLCKIAEEAFEARKAELTEDGKAGRWFSPLELHVLPKLGRVPIEEIDQRDILDVLAPL